MKSSLFYLFLFAILFFSCQSPFSDFEEIQTDSPYDFHSIVSFDGNYYATGGDVWSRGNLAKSNDGITWLVDSLTNKSIFDLYQDGTSLYGVGVDGYIFRGQPDLSLSRTKWWDMLRGYTSTPTGGIAVGGKDFNKGWIYKVNDDLKIDTTFFYDYELSKVDCNDGTCLAVGFGNILRSYNDGSSWETLSKTGDFFIDIAFNDQGTPYVVGHRGSLIYSKDKGDTWIKYKNGHSPLSNNRPFRSIIFSDNVGVIVGDNGTILVSEDNGSSWQDISIDTDLDLYDVVYDNGWLLIVSEVGKVIRLPYAI